MRMIDGEVKGGRGEQSGFREEVEGEKGDCMWKEEEEEEGYLVGGNKRERAKQKREKGGER